MYNPMARYNPHFLPIRTTAHKDPLTRPKNQVAWATLPHYHRTVPANATSPAQAHPHVQPDPDYSSECCVSLRLADLPASSMDPHSRLPQLLLLIATGLSFASCFGANGYGRVVVREAMAWKAVG